MEGYMNSTYMRHIIIGQVTMGLVMAGSLSTIVYPLSIVSGWMSTLILSLSGSFTPSRHLHSLI